MGLRPQHGYDAQGQQNCKKLLHIEILKFKGVKIGLGLLNICKKKYKWSLIKWQMSRFAFMSNPYRFIKHLALLAGVCIVTGSAVRAQQSYYIYIQSDNGQPFYTQIGDKVYSSSAIGHVIIAGLKDNVCNFEIGFPQHASRPQQFSVSIHGKDHGYQLKKNGTEWTLYNWQNQETIKPNRGSGTSAVLYGDRKKDDAFATLMAAVVNDSSVLYTSIVKNDAVDIAPALAKTEVKQPAPATNEASIDSATTTSITPAPDSTKTYKSEKPLFDTSASVAATPFKNDKPLYDTTKAVEKPYKSEKPLFDTAVTVAKVYKSEKPLYDTTTSTASTIPYKNGKPLYDTTTTTAVLAKPVDETPVKDTATVAKSIVNEPKAEKKTKSSVSTKPGVVKVQETTNKDGETKLVFIDSSESPANVVTVYISQEQTPVQQKAPAQPVSSEPLTATGAPKPETDQKSDPEKKPDANKKADATLKTETAKTEPANTKKDTEKVTVAPTKQEGAQTTKSEPLYRPAAEKPSGKKTDTLTIILESPQMKMNTPAKTVKQEAPKPLYESKQVTEPVAKQNDAEKAGITPATGAVTTPPKQEVVITTRQDVPLTTKQDVPATTRQDGPVNSKTPDKPTTTDNQSVQREPSKPAAETDKKVVNEPVTSRKDTAVAKQETPKALYNPKPAESDKKKIVMINSDCARFATDNDVDKLRVKMLAENDVAKRVAIANKVFKTMCLSAKQMKALSELFTTDETKYSFLSMAYPFAADTENFKQLFELFTVESYQTKFKTLVRY
jgi:hypothetical protein